MANEFKTKNGIIYKFRNKINNKVYIGQTMKTFVSRYTSNPKFWYNSVSNNHFKRALLKYSHENFEVLLLETDINN